MFKKIRRFSLSAFCDVFFDHCIHVTLAVWNILSYIFFKGILKQFDYLNKDNSKFGVPKLAIYEEIIKRVKRVVTTLDKTINNISVIFSHCFKARYRSVVFFHFG